MRPIMLRLILFAIGAVLILCGTMLLLPYYRGAIHYVNSRMAFCMSILLVAYGGYWIGLATRGFHGMASTALVRKFSLKSPNGA